MPAVLHDVDLRVNPIMTRFEESIVIDAAPERVFEVVHDYGVRLAWDGFLRKVAVLDEDGNALPLDSPVHIGTRIACTARRLAGGITLETEYVSLRPPETAAVKLVRGPWWFKSFAARMSTTRTTDGRTLWTGLYQFQCRPRLLVWLIERVVRWIFARETRRRIQGLKRYVESSSPRCRPTN